jgi:hypothetical protein
MVMSLQCERSLGEDQTSREWSRRAGSLRIRIGDVPGVARLVGPTNVDIGAAV